MAVTAETWRRLATESLYRAYGVVAGAHFLHMVAARPEAKMSAEILLQRKAVFELASQLVAKELDEQMDALVIHWQNFKKAKEQEDAESRDEGMVRGTG